MNRKRIFQILIIASLLISGISYFPKSAGVAKAQPQLVQLAVNQPDQLVSIIVQKAGTETGVERTAASLGGQVTRDLSIINAFAAKMTAGQAVELAKAAGVKWVSIDAPVVKSGGPDGVVNTGNLLNVYDKAIGADKLWAKGYQGSSIAVAVVDSGVNPNGDLYSNSGANRELADVRFNNDYNQSTSDGYGHGTVISSIIAGDGSDSGGKYIGVAPMANIVNVKVSNDDGSALTSNVVAGLGWILNHKDQYNIRVVNLSFNCTTAESYNQNALDAAVEILWFNKIVVVVSAGNQGNGAIYPPANDPFVITVGAVDDNGTTKISDDVISSFSAYGTTSDGFKKPDLVAPGRNIIGRLVNTNMGMGQAHPANVIANGYFKLSGTSVSAPMVSGAVALLLQDEPNLTPDQVKYRLMATANKNWAGYNADTAGAGYLNVFSAVNGTTNQSANTGIKASNLLTTGGNPITWNSVGWNSVGWNSVGWNSVGWNSVGWNSVGWNSDHWGN